MMAIVPMAATTVSEWQDKNNIQVNASTFVSGQCLFLGEQQIAAFVDCLMSTMVIPVVMTAIVFMVMISTEDYQCP